MRHQKQYRDAESLDTLLEERQEWCTRTEYNIIHGLSYDSPSHLLPRIPRHRWYRKATQWLRRHVQEPR